MNPMKAIVQDRFGPPAVLRLTDIERPEAGPGEVLVRVHAAALNPYDWHMLRGDPYVARLIGMGLTRPKHRVAGLDAAGRVEAVGAGVSGLRPGDEVLGYCQGAFAEYALTTADKLVRKPAGLTFEQAATVPVAGATALRAIRDVGKAGPGHQVLVNGAAGGVGTYAVQIAAAQGAEVTGVSSGGNTDLVRSLGAAHAIDYEKEDFTEGPRRYDLILDNVGNHPVHRLRRALTARGTLAVNAGGAPGAFFGAVGLMLRAVALNVVVRQHLKPVPTRLLQEELRFLTALIEKGELTPVLTRAHPLAETAEALSRLEQGHTRGKIAITVPLLAVP